MPKESVIINEFNGMSPAISGGQSCILAKGIDVSTPLNVVSQEKADTLTTATTNTTVNALKTTIDGTDVTVRIKKSGALYVNDVAYSGVSAINSTIDALGNAISIVSNVEDNPRIVSYRKGTSSDVFGSDGVVVEDDIITNSYSSLGTPKKVIALNDSQMLVLVDGAKNLVLYSGVGGATQTATKSVDLTIGEIVDFDCSIESYSSAGTVLLQRRICYVLTRATDTSSLQCKKFNIGECYTNAITSNPGAYISGSFESASMVDAGMLTISEASVMFGRQIGSIAVTKDRLFFGIKGRLDATDNTMFPEGSENDDVENDFLFAWDIAWPTSSVLSVHCGATGTGHLKKSRLPIGYALHTFSYRCSVSGSIAVVQYNNNIVGIQADRYSRTTTGGSTWNPNGSVLMCWQGAIEASTVREFLRTSSFGIHTGGYGKSIASAPFSGYGLTVEGVNSYYGISSFIYLIGAASQYTTYQVVDSIDLLNTNYSDIRIFNGNSSISPDGFLGLKTESVFGMSPNTMNFFEFGYHSSVVWSSGSFKVYFANSINAHGNIETEREVKSEEVTDSGAFSTPFIDTDVVAATGAIEGGTVTRYKYAFIYDGTTIGPLSSEFFEVTDESNYQVILKISLSSELLNKMKRVSGINIYSAEADDTVVNGGTEIEYYRRIETLQLDDDTFPIVGISPYAERVDRGTRYESFEAGAGYSETAQTISLKRGCQCSYLGYLFVGNISVPIASEHRYTKNVLARSLPMQPSAFNYAKDFIVLPFTPTAIIGSSGRLYAFSDESYCIINPLSLSIDAESKLLGILGRHQAIDTDYGLFCFSDGKLFHVDGLNAKDVSTGIASSIDGKTTSLADLAGDAVVTYNNEKDSIFVIGRSSYGITAFALSLVTGKWVVYELYQDSNTAPPENKSTIKESASQFSDVRSYVLNGIHYVVSSKLLKEISLFTGNTYREVEMLFSLDLGDPVHKTYIYDGGCMLYDKETPHAVYINGDKMPKTTLLSGNEEAILKVSIESGASKKSFDSIRLTTRKLVLT